VSEWCRCIHSGVCRFTGFLMCMKSLGCILAMPSPKKLAARQRSSPAAVMGVDNVVHVGAELTAHTVGNKVSSAMRHFFEVLQGAVKDVTKEPLDILSNDAAYDKALEQLPGMGAYSCYVRPHIRRKRLYMMCMEVPDIAHKLWDNIKVKTLSDMVPDTSEFLQQFDQDAPASSVNALFGFPRATGPLLISCYGCLCKPLAEANLKVQLRTRAYQQEMASARLRYLEEQAGFSFICEPCPARCMERCESNLAPTQMFTPKKKRVRPTGPEDEKPIPGKPKRQARTINGPQEKATTTHPPKTHLPTHPCFNRLHRWPPHVTECFMQGYQQRERFLD
jgi:hypothetical protein